MDAIKDIEEVIFATDSADSSFNCCVWNPTTGNQLTTFTEENSVPGTLCLLAQEYLMSAAINKPFLKIWRFNKKHDSKKLACGGNVNALAVSPSAVYCVLAIKRIIHVYMLSTGDCLVMLDSHLNDVTRIRFTDDGSYFISGGKDGCVMVWELKDILNEESIRNIYRPRNKWIHHDNEVTDVHVSCLGNATRIASCSLDSTCNVYELESGCHEHSVQTSMPLTCISMDVLEDFLMLGTATGEILKLELWNCDTKQICQQSHHIHKAHRASVTCIAFAKFSAVMISGSEDQSIKIWNFESMVSLKVLQHKGAITNAVFMLQPSSLFSDENRPPQIPISPFTRQVAINKVAALQKPVPLMLSEQEITEPKDIFKQKIIIHHPAHLLGSSLSAEDAVRLQETYKSTIANKYYYTLALQGAEIQ